MFLALLFLFPVHVYENVTENKLFMKPYSVLRIASEEIMHQTYSLAYIKDKELNHGQSCKLWERLSFRKFNRLIRLGTVKGWHTTRHEHAI